MTDYTDNDTEYETEKNSNYYKNVKSLNEKNSILIDIVKRQETFLKN